MRPYSPTTLCLGQQVYAPALDLYPRNGLCTFAIIAGTRPGLDLPALTVTAVIESLADLSMGNL